MLMMTLSNTPHPCLTYFQTHPITQWLLYRTHPYPPPRAPVVPLTRYLLPTRYFAVYYPTPDPIIERMLRLANVSAKDTVYDLGCGDGRGEAAGRALMIGGG